MPCAHPIDARRSPGGKIGFRPMTPFDQLLKLPCGRCIWCRLERARQMAVRGTHEMQLHQHSCFITLTIRDATYSQLEQDAYCAQLALCTDAQIADLPTGSNIAPDARLNSREYRSGGPVDRSALRAVRVPYTAGTRARPSLASPEGRGASLNIEDHQKFMSRMLSKLRSYGPIKPVRFLMCGEYGEKNWRPHYHYILFGYDFPDKRPFKRKNGYQLYRSSLLDQLWPHGHADIAEANFETINYVAGYITKKINGALADEHYRRQLPNGTNYWLQPEFTQMSRRPGLGAGWIKKYHTSVYPHDRVIINHVEAKPPRYYDEALKRLDPNALERVKESREQELAKQNPDNHSPERLRAGETILRAKLNLRKRSLE